ncbi:MAG: FmdB family zinc ribbon protein [Pseudomonadota bacterium]
MPIYEYRCLKCGHQFEKLQNITDRAVSRCEECGERVTRVFHPVAIHFKGSGFYTTDYRKKGGSARKSAEKTEKSGTTEKEASGSKKD